MQKRTTKPRISDIAAVAGVSKSTVSRALKDSEQISETTKARIRAIADSALVEGRGRAGGALGRVGTVGVAIPIHTSSRQRISHPFNMELLGSISDTLMSHGYNMYLAQMPMWSKRIVTQFFDTSQADGFIVIGQAGDYEEINRIAKEVGPMVVWGSQVEGTEHCTVGSDNVFAAERAVSHLIELGRRSIVFLGDIRMPEAVDRFEGYKRALAAASIPFSESRVIHTSGDRSPTYNELRKRIAAGLTLDALFSPNDIAAMNSILALSDSGLRVPDDVSVVGFDDIDAAGYYNPPLTTVRQDVVEGGHVLVEKLVRLINGEPADSVVIPAELIVRKSCGAGQLKPA